MQPPPARSRAFHATRSGWLGCEVDAIPLRLHRSTHWKCSRSPQMHSRRDLRHVHILPVFCPTGQHRDSLQVERSETHRPYPTESMMGFASALPILRRKRKTSLRWRCSWRRRFAHAANQTVHNNSYLGGQRACARPKNADWHRTAGHPIQDGPQLSIPNVILNHP